MSGLVAFTKIWVETTIHWRHFFAEVSNVPLSNHVSGIARIMKFVGQCWHFQRQSIRLARPNYCMLKSSVNLKKNQGKPTIFVAKRDGLNVDHHKIPCRHWLNLSDLETGSEFQSKNIQEKPTNCGFKAKRKGPKTWNVHQSETHPQLRITLNTKFCSVCHRLADI